MRGQGSIYLRGEIYWLRFSWQGTEYRKSTKTSDLDEAKRRQSEYIQRLKNGTPTNLSRRDTILYIIQRENGPIKVGISANLKSRLRTLQNGNAERITVLRKYTMRDVEKAIHRMLRDSRLEGEWFAADSFSTVEQFFRWTG